MSKTKPKFVPISLRITEDQKEKMDALAVENRRSFTGEMQVAVENHIKASLHGKKS